MKIKFSFLGVDYVRDNKSNYLEYEEVIRDDLVFHLIYNGGHNLNVKGELIRFKNEPFDTEWIKKVGWEVLDIAYNKSDNWIGAMLAEILLNNNRI